MMRFGKHNTRPASPVFLAAVIFAAALIGSPLSAREQPPDAEGAVRILMADFADDLQERFAKDAGTNAAAVLDLRISPPEAGSQLGKSAADELELEISERGTFPLADRSHISEIFSELNLEKSGITSADSAHQVGKLAGVKELVIGNIFLGDGETSAILRLVDMDSGRIEWIGRRDAAFENSSDLPDETLDKILWIKAAEQAAKNALAGLLKKSFGDDVEVIAVGRFRNTSGYGFFGFEDFATDAVSQALFESTDSYKIVERQYMDELFMEKTFEKSGVVDLDGARRIAQMLSVDVLLVGDIKITQTGTQRDIYGKKQKVVVTAGVSLKLLQMSSGLLIASSRGEQSLEN